METPGGRAPFQVLILPYRQIGDTYEYALFRRADAAYWQGVAGGGEDDETQLEAARRETAEETGLVDDRRFMALDARAAIPVIQVTGEFTWGPDVLVIPEYTFGVQVPGRHGEITLSHEHTEVAWFGLEKASRAVKWDSNRTALWELDYRLHHGTAGRAV